MQPLVPYLLGQEHPQGGRLVNSQKCFRSVDIDEIGDNRHHTFFEMLGNWSFGDYFKEEQLRWFFEFLVDDLGIDPKKLFVTVFSGDPDYSIPADTQSVETWKKLFKERDVTAKDIRLDSEENAAKTGMQDGRIFYYKAKNWWSRAGTPEKMPVGEPGGPDSEVFYCFEEVKHDSRFGEHCHPNCDCGRFLEIGNSVFMEYRKNPDGTFGQLPKKNVDFGGGLERIAMAVGNNHDSFSLDVFQAIIHTLERLSGFKYEHPQHQTSMRVIADHLRAAAFLIGDGVVPSNTDQGYYVRRLIRRAVRHLDLLGVHQHDLAHLVPTILSYYEEAYPKTFEKRFEIEEEVSKEEQKFRKTLEIGLKELRKIGGNDCALINGENLFVLFSTYGFPLELSIEQLEHQDKVAITSSSKEKWQEEFWSEFKKHQELSRSGAEQKFKGGLADVSEKSLKYHTATHLLHQALFEVLGPSVSQKGSNITPERLRFDFTHDKKMTDEEKLAVEKIVNRVIKQALPVQKIIMSKGEALKTGAKHFFGEKYGDEVSIYFVGNDLNSAFSKEFCGGPHVTNTSELGHFKIVKEEAVSAGVRRIRGILE